MAIDSATLQTEISARNLAGASSKIIARILNEPGSASVETWVVAGSERRILKSLLLSYISIANLAAFSDWLETNTSETAKAFRLFWSANDEFDMTNDRARVLVNFLQTQSLIAADEKTEILRMGEELNSRAMELFEKLITAEDVEEAR